MSVARFLDVLSELEEQCHETLDECICCGNESDYRLIRLSFCPCHTSVRYGICQDCRETPVSEKLIETEMREAYLQGWRDTPREFEQLIQEASEQNWW
jgi:hypothetical protein